MRRHLRFPWTWLQLLFFSCLFAMFGCGGKSETGGKELTAGDVPGEEAERLNELELAPDVQQAWLEAGFTPGWQGRDQFGRLVFRRERFPLKAEYPAFEVPAGMGDRLTKLPSPDRPFGLDLSKSEISTVDLQALLEFRNLVSIRLPDSVGDADMHLIGKIKGLQYLDLSGAKVTSAGLRPIRQLSNLEQLILASTAITDEGLFELSDCANLRSLWLSDTEVTDRGIDELARNTALEQFDLSGCNLTDEAISALNDLPDLKILDLSRTQLTDSAVPDLAKIRSLVWLQVYRTKITSSGVEALKGTFGKTLRIDH